MSISVRNITKNFGDFTALKGVSLDIPDGDLAALLGPSGSGKTTLLRLIAGLEFPDDGEVHFDGQDTTALDVRDRRVGFVFQHYALFRHMSVYENVAFGLRVLPRKERPAEAEIRKRVMRLLELVQLDWLADRFPSQLSGGQRQRIALARALAIEPRVLLLDEPFGALDAQVRKDLRRWLRQLHDEIHVTSVFVTHDQEEALEVADRVVVMDHGHIVQVGSPIEVHDHPATPFVCEFLGSAVRFDGVVEGGQLRIGNWHRASTHAAGAVRAYVRPHEMAVLPGIVPEAAASFAIRHIVARGGLARLELSAEGGAIVEAEMPRHKLEAAGLAVGSPVSLCPDVVHVFPA
ncbi:sulfate/molybdate ABC transporter ATP-binding protein [Radicibacter daui]|uniref:sulfate/molybdate ABC transporter ATP-binding protein n=1 Tax=Radicibacter daui TaxID=3064829 RepID=UPI004046E826